MLLAKRSWLSLVQPAGATSCELGTHGFGPKQVSQRMGKSEDSTPALLTSPEGGRGARREGGDGRSACGITGNARSSMCSLLGGILMSELCLNEKWEDEALCLLLSEKVSTARARPTPKSAFHPPSNQHNLVLDSALHHQPRHLTTMADVLPPSSDPSATPASDSLEQVSTGLLCRNCAKPASTQTTCPVCFA